MPKIPTTKPLLEFETFGGYVVEILNVLELNEFITREKNCYNKLFKPTNSDLSNLDRKSPLDRLAKEQKSRRDRVLDNFIELYKKIQEHEINLHSALNPIKYTEKKLREILIEKNFIASKSSAGVLISDTLEVEGKEIAIMLYLLFMKPDVHYPTVFRDSIHRAKGIYDIFMEDKTNIEPQEELSPIDTEKKATTRELVGKTFKDIETLKNELELLKEALKETQQNSEDLITLLDGQQTITITEIESLKTNSRNSIESYTKSQIKAVETSPSRTYWNKKKWWHRGWAAFMIAIISLTICSVIYGYTEYLISFTHIDQTPFLEMGISDFKIGQIGISIFTISIIIWILRFQSKILVSHLHRAGDATERVTMIDTYISLIAENAVSKLNDLDMQLILQVIFRPTIDGFVKDDGPGFQFNIPNMISTKPS